MSLSTRLTSLAARLVSAIAMAALATIMLAPAAQAQDVSVSIDDESGLVGDTVEVPVSTTELAEEDSVDSFEFDVEYDTTVADPVGIITDGTLSSDLSNVSLSENPGADNEFRVSGFGTSPITGSGTLVSVQFAIEGSGTSELSFNRFLYNDGTPPVATGDGTLDAEGLVLLGDPTENGSVSALDASLTLRAAAELDTLDAAQQAAADVDGDTDVTSNDASEILKFVVGIIDEFPAENGSSSSSTQAIASTANLEWGEVESDDGSRSLPVRLSGSVDGVQAVSLTLTGDVESINLDGLSDRLPQGWQLVRNAYDGGDEAKIVMAGAEPITDDGELVRLPLGGDSGSIEASGTINGSVQATLGAAPTIDRPGSFALQGNFPNPVTQSTAITFDVPEKASVEVEVYDMLGRRVLSTPARTVSAGEGRSIRVDASDLSSGAYIYRLKAETDGGETSSWRDSGRMVIVK